MKKLLKIIIILFLICILILIFKCCNSYFTYKKILSIIDNARQQVATINNVSISSEVILNGQQQTNVIENSIVIKDLIQCSTNNRELVEKYNGDYTLTNFNENVSYRIEAHYNDKKIYIETAENKDLYTVELLYIPIPDFSIISSYKYKVIEENDSFKISFYNKNEDIFEQNYWISKENGLLLKKNLKYITSSNNEEMENEETSIYLYDFDVVTDEDVGSINLNDYIDYIIIDNR